MNKKIYVLISFALLISSICFSMDHSEKDKPNKRYERTTKSLFELYWSQNSDDSRQGQSSIPAFSTEHNQQKTLTTEKKFSSRKEFKSFIFNQSFFIKMLGGSLASYIAYYLILQSSENGILASFISNNPLIPFQSSSGGIINFLLNNRTRLIGRLQFLLLKHFGKVIITALGMWAVFSCYKAYVAYERQNRAIEASQDIPFSLPSISSSQSPSSFVLPLSLQAYKRLSYEQENKAITKELIHAIESFCKEVLQSPFASEDKNSIQAIEENSEEEGSSSSYLEAANGDNLLPRIENIREINRALTAQLAEIAQDLDATKNWLALNAPDNPHASLISTCGLAKQHFALSEIPYNIAHPIYHTKNLLELIACGVLALDATSGAPTIFVDHDGMSNRNNWSKSTKCILSDSSSLQELIAQCITLYCNKGHLPEGFDLKIPSALSALRNLEKLSIAQADEASPAVLSSPQLTSFALCYSPNATFDILSHFNSCTNLTELHLTNNKLTTIPDKVLRALKKLQKLNVSSNQLTKLPVTISALTNLETLDASYNQLSTVPATISTFPNLTQLSLNNNKIATISPDISRLTNLETLDLSCNPIKKLPAGFTSLTNLTKLELGGSVQSSRCLSIQEWRQTSPALFTP